MRMEDMAAELMAQTLDMKVWVLGEGEQSRAGALGKVLQTPKPESARGRVQDPNGLQIFSLALLFIYGEMNQ